MSNALLQLKKEVSDMLVFKIPMHAGPVTRMENMVMHQLQIATCNVKMMSQEDYAVVHGETVCLT